MYQFECGNKCLIENGESNARRAVHEALNVTSFQTLILGSGMDTFLSMLRYTELVWSMPQKKRTHLTLNYHFKRWKLTPFSCRLCGRLPSWYGTCGMRYHKSHKLRMWRNKSYYSLDRGDGIEHAAKYVEPSSEEMYMRKVEMEQFCDALNSLPEKQGHRVNAYYILGMKQYEIAKAEGVSNSCVTESISTGIRNMKKYLQKL